MRIRTCSESLYKRGNYPGKVINSITLGVRSNPGSQPGRNVRQQSSIRPRVPRIIARAQQKPVLKQSNLVADTIGKL